MRFLDLWQKLENMQGLAIGAPEEIWRLTNLGIKWT
jgi:hypothetical protein